MAGAKEGGRIEIRLSVHKKRVFQAGTFSLCGSLPSCKEVPLTTHAMQATSDDEANQAARPMKQRRKEEL